MLRGLSHLPVVVGKEAQALNREIIPQLREIGGEVASLGPMVQQIIELLEGIAGGDSVAEIVEKLDEMIVILEGIQENQQVPAAGSVFGSLAGIATTPNFNFAPKAAKRGIVIVNLDATNNLLISRGVPAAGDVNTSTVKPNTPSPFLPCTDVSVFNMRSSASTVSACYFGA